MNRLKRIIGKAINLKGFGGLLGAVLLSAALWPSAAFATGEPTVLILVPPDNSYATSLPAVSGTAWDDVEVSSVVLSFRNQGTGKYWGGSSFDSTPEAWFEATLVVNAWSYASPAWVDGNSYLIVAKAKDSSDNWSVVYATASVSFDTTVPVSTVTYPVHGADLSVDVNLIAGSAADISPGAVGQVLVSYYRVDTARYWDLATGAWDSVSEIFYGATVLGDRWEAAGVSTPTWVTTLPGVEYRIFAKAVDLAGNETAKPGLPAADSSYIQFVLRTPAPVSVIVTPDAGIPHWIASNQPTILGTAVNATTVQVRITDFGADLTEGAGSDDLVWDGGQWLSAESNPSLYAGVDAFNGLDWAITLPAVSWNSNRKYRVISKGYELTNDLWETPGAGREFVIDSISPTGSITAPAGLYTGGVTALTASVSDTAPGSVYSAYFRVKRQSADEYWDWTASTFATLGVNSDLTATINAGNASYTTGYFQNGQAWEPDQSYTVQLFVLDKAGNIGTAAEQTFTLDASSPVARILVPSNAKAVRYLPSISGTAFDDHQNQTVEVAVQKWMSGINLWYDGSGFNDAATDPHWISVNTYGYLSPDATSWAYAPAGLDDDFASGYQYLLLVRASDTAGNFQTSYTVGVSSIVIKIDKEAPLSVILRPVADGRYRAADIGQFPSNHLQGTAYDAPADIHGGLNQTYIRLSYLQSGDTFYWTGTAFSSGTVTEATAWQSAALSGSDPVWTWDYTTNITWPAGDREYTVDAKSMDDSRLSDTSGDGNWEASPATWKFIVDDTAPTVLITSPTVNALSALSAVYGTANADSAGFSYVEIRISTGAGASTRYWLGSGWTAAEDTWVTGAQLGPTSWYYTVDQPMLASDRAYVFEARAVDNAGNRSTLYSTYTVTYDTLPPYVALTYPLDGAAYSQVKISTPVTGTSNQDDQNEVYSKVSVVRVQIEDLTVPTCFDGSAFSACPQWLAATGVDSWSYNAPNLSFANDHQYKVYTKAVDFAGNASTINSVTINYDLERPTSTITSPLSGSTTGFAQITGTATDERVGARSYESKLGTYTVKVAIKRLTAPPGWWTGSDFGGVQPVWYEAYTDTATGSFPVNFSYTLPAGLKTEMALPANLGVSYWIVPWSYDLAENREYGPNSGEPQAADVPVGVGYTYVYLYVTKVGSALNWQWKIPEAGDYVMSGSADSWQWLLWEPGSGRKVPQGDAGGWSWGDEAGGLVEPQ